ncbi:MAG: hypothetical protein QM831_34575 [Kofleriaceae bacterium]
MATSDDGSEDGVGGKADGVGLAPLTGAVRVFAGTDHTCALLADGSVKCWGNDREGQLGIPDPEYQQTSPPLPPTNVATIGWRCTPNATCRTPFPTLSSLSINASCAMNDEGTVVCARDALSGVPTELDELTALGGVRVLSTGLGSHACVAMFDSAFNWHCWGDNYYNQLGGQPWTLEDPYEDGVVENMSGGFGNARINTQYDELVVGGRHTCGHRAWLAGYGVECWGANDHGQLGQGTTGSSSAAHQWIESIDNKTHSLSAGWAHTCAIHDPDGQVLCWGANEEGQLGDGSNVARSVPTVVTGVTGVSTIAAGGAHTCVLVGTDVKCWGLNDRGQIGNGGGGQPGPAPVIVGLDGPIVYVAAPITVALAGPAIDVSSGYRHTCAVLADGRVQCWGYNVQGQLGDATFSDRAKPVFVLQR